MWYLDISYLTREGHALEQVAFHEFILGELKRLQSADWPTGLSIAEVFELIIAVKVPETHKPELRKALETLKSGVQFSYADGSRTKKAYLRAMEILSSGVVPGRDRSHP